jgi:hypothetical protein
MNSLRERLEQLGLTNFAVLCLDVLEPVSPFAAQVLWVMQPTLGIFINRQQVGDWAQLMEDPERVAELREQLAKKWN